jgi:hypothetical protein
LWQWRRKRSSAHCPCWIHTVHPVHAEKMIRDMSRSPSPICSVFSQWKLLFVAREWLNPTTLHLCILQSHSWSRAVMVWPRNRSFRDSPWHNASL